MNAMLYNTAMNKITMSEECEKRILETAESAVPTAEKKRLKIRFIPVLAAAAVLVTSTITAAASGFDWIKGFFDNEDFEVTDDVAGLMGEIDNFTYESNCGIELSPVGMIANESTLYCMFSFDEVPDGIDLEHWKIAQIYTDKTTREITYENENCFYDLGDTDEGNSLMSTVTDLSENLLKLRVFSNNEENRNVFSNGENITVRVNRYYGGDVTDDYVKINFDINNISNEKFVNLNLDRETEIKLGVDTAVIRELTITPFRITSAGASVTPGEPISDLYPNDSSLIITMKDGTTISSEYLGWSGTNINGSLSYELEWRNDSPINPDNISTVSIDGICLYDANH